MPKAKHFEQKVLYGTKKKKERQRKSEEGGGGGVVMFVSRDASIHSEREPGSRSSPRRIFPGIPLARPSLVDGGKLMRCDGRSAVADKQHTGRCQPPPPHTENQKHTHATTFGQTRGGGGGLGMKTLSDKHPLLHYQQLHNNKRSYLSQKSLKVTEWILIRSGVVNSSQHGLQWD